MVYVVVFLASLLGILGILGTRAILLNRNVRRFVRALQGRRSHGVRREAQADRQPQRPGVASRPRHEFQKLRTILRAADRALAKQDGAEGERLLIQALMIDPESLEAKACLAHLYLTSSRESKAEALYREIVQQSGSVVFSANLGLSCYRQGKFVESCYAYQEALNRDPHSPQRSYDLGKACMAAHRFADAARLLEKTASRLPRDTQLLRLLAECYLQIQDVQNAERTYRCIHRIEPYDEEIKRKIVSLSQVSS